MVATDTIVGIAGAVVLVAVMAGVFVYEYNNTPAPVEEPPRLPFLDPDGDLDGDGTRNADDRDADGDGVPDDEDDSIERTDTSSGSLGPTTPLTAPSFPHEFPVEAGNRHVMVEVVATPTADNPAISDFVVELVSPDGETTTANANAGETYVIETEAPVAPGTWTVRVTGAQGSAGGSFDVTTTVHYG